MSRGNIYIISGPSGSGKDTILKEVLKIRSDVFFSISHITRKMRVGEVEGDKYMLNIFKVDAETGDKLDGAIFESIVIADLAPIPLTDNKSSNIVNSSLEIKPYKLILSSLT